MKVLLTIGHMDILLPNDQGLQTIMKALAKGHSASDRSYLRRNRPAIVVNVDPIEVSFKYVSTKYEIIPATNQHADLPPEPETLRLEAPSAIIL